MSLGRAAAAAGLATTVLLAGCAPASWPTRPEVPRAPLPPVTSSPRPHVSAPEPGAGIEAPPAPVLGPAPEPGTGPGNPPFYDVLGERYFVLPSSEGYRERGVASWYGAPFHGRRTSSGAVYDMHGFTAAHKTLPLPSLVRVTNLDTGRSVVVTVNDRGPFVKDRLIDVSYAAAKQLGLVESGTARVEIEAVGARVGASLAAPSAAADRAVAPALAPAQRLFMQVGAFSDESNAARLKTSLESNGVNNVVIRYDADASPAVYRVRIGPIGNSAEYDALASRVESFRIANPRPVTESAVNHGPAPNP